MIEAAETALRDGRTHRRREAAERVAFLVDGDAYFAAFRAAHRHGRRRILCRVVLGAKEEDHGGARVHGKTLVVDDRLVRVGSGNLSNRSMGVDTECDLAIEAENEATRAGIAAFRGRLLAAHRFLDDHFLVAVILVLAALGYALQRWLGVDEEHQ